MPVLDLVQDCLAIAAELRAEPESAETITRLAYAMDMVVTSEPADAEEANGVVCVLMANLEGLAHSVAAGNPPDGLTLIRIAKGLDTLGRFLGDLSAGAAAATRPERLN